MLTGTTRVRALAQGHLKRLPLMNRRHAAALALVGWYLMVPPRKPDGWPGLKAPLLEWTVEGGEFSSAQNCESSIGKLLTDLGKQYDSSENERYRKSLMAAMCVDRNDPRVKGKQWPWFLPVASGLGEAAN